MSRFSEWRRERRETRGMSTGDLLVWTWQNHPERFHIFESSLNPPQWALRPDLIRATYPHPFRSTRGKFCWCGMPAHALRHQVGRTA